MKLAGTVHVEHIVHEFQPLDTIQGLCLHTQPVEVVQQIVLDVVKPGLDLCHAFALHTKGDEFGLGQTIIALGKLLAQHLGILRTNIVKTVLLVRNADALFKLGAVGCHVHKGQLKFDAGIKKVQKAAPFLENGGLILLLRQLIVDVLVGDRPGVVVCTDPASAILKHPLHGNGLLGGAFVLKEGAARTCRIEGRDALMLEPGTVLEYCHSLLSPSKEHTLSGLVYRSGKWRSYETEHCLSQGMISLRSGNEPLVITNLRYYNWKLEPAERAYDAATDVVRLPAADCRKRGLVVSITADDFAVGDTVPYLTNRGVKGYFEALKAPVVVKETEGKKAFHFDGSQLFRSSFSLPATLQDNAPYTLEAWVLNDSIAENECVADFTTSHDELEKIMLVNGTEPRCGVINHYGWYEDAGYKGMKELTGRWQHIYICFDGRMEQVYINGEQVSGKDIQLLVKPSQFVTLGRNAEGEWPFTGYLHSLKLWDEYIPLQGRK